MAQDSKILVDSITDINGTGAVSFPNSAIVPDGGTIVLNGNLNVGVATVGLITATDINATTINASGGFSGDGSGLTGLPIVDDAKAIALTLIT
jgi:hypothetical protein